MEDFWSQIAVYSDYVAREWEGFSHWHPPGRVFALISLICAAAAMVASRIMSGPNVVTIPITYIVFFFAAMMSNYLGREIHFSGQSDVTRTVIFSTPAVCLAAFIVLMMFKTSEAGVEGRG